ncbi:MAG: DUF3341 domain-containing protein, partial [bacterium]|nr:DUF3341 domain-containing protein [bacterium]
PAFIPVVFELTVLLSAFGALFGFLTLSRLPMHYHPLFKCAGFARVTTDGFYLSIDARDPAFDPQRSREILESLGGSNIALLEP